MKLRVFGTTAKSPKNWNVHNKNISNAFLNFRTLNKKKIKIKKKVHMVNKIFNKAESGDDRAIFLTDIIKNFSKKTPRWSEMSIRLCTVWRFCSPKVIDSAIIIWLNFRAKVPCRGISMNIKGRTPLFNNVLKLPH